MFAFCETVTAGPLSPWHIRVIPDGEARKFGGGATTPALCGRVVAWDLEVGITPHHLTHACTRCVAVYREETP